MGRKPKEPENNLDLQNKLSELKSKIKKIGNLDKKDDSSLFHYEAPVSPKEFIESEKYFGNKTKRIVRPWVIETMEEIFSKGPYHLPKYQTAVMICGKGSGKSYLGALMNVYAKYQILCFKDFIQYLNTEYSLTLSSDTLINIAGAAITKDAAKFIVFDTTRNIIQQVKAFRDRDWIPDPNITTKLQYYDTNQYGEKRNKLSIVPGNSSDKGFLGLLVWAGIIDEAAFFMEKNHDPVEDIYKELHGRRFSRFGQNGILTLISSARSQDAFIEKLYCEAEHDKTIFACRKSVYDCNPQYFLSPRFDLTINYETSDGTIKNAVLKPPIEFKPIYERDLYGALKDFDGIPALVGRPFYPDFVLLASKINKNRQDPAPDLGRDKPESPIDVMQKLPDWFRGNSGLKYRIHVDLAKGSMVQGQCGVGFAMAHKVADPAFGYKIILDLAVRFKSPESKEIQISDILALIKFLKEVRGFDIELVTFDQWQSMSPKQTIESWRNGTSADELKVAYQQHTFLKMSILTGQLDMYEDTNLLFELKRLEDYENSVQHGPNSFKDEADAVAGVVFSVGAMEPGKEIVKPRCAVGIVLPRTAGTVRVSRPPGMYRGRNGPQQSLGGSSF